mmetsp:Transcript_154639/g.495820  ORF Transcript_154639/g.495820 Transcript_154639/m.495820 type:complete len:575 (-) Transcript_154639:541-2265(-)
MMLQSAPQHLRDDAPLARIHGLQSQVRNLQQHGAQVMGAVQHLEIDVHVVRQLTQALRSFLLRSLVLEPAEGETLGQQLTVLAVHAHVHHAAVGILDLTQAEGAQAHLGQASVVENLHVNVGLPRLLLQVREVQQIPRLLEVVVQCQVEDLAQQGPALTSDVSRGEDILGQLAHEGCRLLGPHPSRFLDIRGSVVDGVVEGLVEDVVFVVQMLHQAQGGCSQGLFLVGILKEMEQVLEQHQELRRVREDLLILCSVNVRDELQCLVELVVQLLCDSDEQLLLPPVVCRVGVFKVFHGLDLLVGHALVLQILVRCDQQGQHIVDLVQCTIPQNHVHGGLGAACIVEVGGHHRRVNVQHVPGTLLLCMEHQLHHLINIGLSVEATTTTRLSDLHDLFDQLLCVVFIGLLHILARIHIAAFLLRVLNLLGLPCRLFIDLVLLKSGLGALLSFGLWRDEPPQHLLLACRIRVFVTGVAVGATGVSVGVGIAAAAASGRTVRVAVAVRIAAGRAAAGGAGTAVGRACGVAVGILSRRFLFFLGFELGGVILEGLNLRLVVFVALADLGPQGVERAGLGL